MPRPVVPQAGFTLVVIMVVVFVIGILVALLIPNIRGGKEKAQSTMCKSNLRQYGVAVNQYIADYQGYFIFPGTTTTNIYQVTMGDKAQVATEGSAHTWENLVAGYIPDPVTQNSLAARKPSVRICPSIDPQIFLPSFPKAFKGFNVPTSGTYKNCELSDFESGYSSGTSPEIIYDSYFSTYAINPLQIYALRSTIPDRLICFIDWNASEGWGANLLYTTWQFSNPLKRIIQDRPKPTTNWWFTEVGFNHGSGSDRYANYLAFDERVDSIKREGTPFQRGISLDDFREVKSSSP